MSSGTRVALVGPSFFSYIQAIRENLEARGVPSVFMDERHSNSIAVKILYRIGFYSIFPARKRRHLDGIANNLVEGGYTDALLIDVEVCDATFVGMLKDAGVRVHLYMWDSARNKPNYLSYLHLLSSGASFDPYDCRNHKLSYIPLFAEEVFSARRHEAILPKERPIDISFCGTLHSNRARRLREVLRFARRRGLKVSLLLYFHSYWLLLIKSLIHLSNASFLLSVSTRGFSKRQIFDLFSRSKYVIDFPHPGQAGLTARTFEVLRSGTNLITFNQEVKSCLPESLLRRVVVIDKIEDLAKIDFYGLPVDPTLGLEDDYFLSLDRFVDQLLGLMGGFSQVPEPKLQSAGGVAGE